LIGIDTNVLVRYFAQDDLRQSRVATRFVERGLSIDQPGHVSLIALAELVRVLCARYAATPIEIDLAVTQLLSDQRFVVQDSRAAWSAIDAVREDGVDMGDALIAAVDRLHGCTHTVTFDAKATRIAGMTLLR
jgi:predicted nucleic-acid-binding protein